MIISRYLIKEISQTLLGVTFVLLLILLSNQLVRFLSYAASGKLASHFLLQLIGFEIPYLLAVLLPLGLFLGIIITYGRLYADTEIPVLNACGYGIRQFFWISITIGLIITCIDLLLTFWVNPIIAAKQGQIMAQGMTQENLIDTLIPGRFQVTNDGHRVVYVEQMGRNHKDARNIFFAEKNKGPESHWIIVAADTGFQFKDNSHEHYMVATNGYRYEGLPGENDYKIIHFKKYSVHIPHIQINTHQIQEAFSTKQLLKNFQQPESAAELEWRISMPISTFLLAILAIPLSRLKPRQGRYANLFPALLIYIIYMNLLFVARNWIEQKTLSPMFGMWWIHFFLLLITFILLKRMSRAR